MNFLGKLKFSLESLRRLDAYSKPMEDFQVKTYFGGTVSVLCWCIIIWLVTSRCYEYYYVNETTETIFVDNSRNHKLYINLDITFSNISCEYLSLDAMDSTGEQHLAIEHKVSKLRLSPTGEPIEAPTKEDVGAPVKDVNRTETKSKGSNISPGAEEVNSPNAEVVKCGSCYGAESHVLNVTCCNTCEDVKEAYRKKEWRITSLDAFEQCKSSADVQKMKKAFNEGCRIYGNMEVNRVGGSFHIAPGESFTMSHVHVHDVSPFSSSAFNTSHKINHLSFGRALVKGKLNPLDGLERISHEASTMFQYYIKIVPTIMVYENGNIVHSNQFSVTTHQKIISPGSGETGMPGVFFSYDLSAMMVKITDKRKSFSHLANDVCSIIGGVWIICMLIDSIFYRSTKLLQKMELGKTN